MGQHRRFPGSFLLVCALVAIPSVLYGFVKAAEGADECALAAKAATDLREENRLKCE